MDSSSATGWKRTFDDTAWLMLWWIRSENRHGPEPSLALPPPVHFRARLLPVVDDRL